jgi:hypothetical protein
MLVLIVAQVRAEQFFKPIPQNGGVAANGLQSSLRFVKPDFGPGESLLASWQITNVSEKPASFSVTTGKWYDLQIRVRRNGQDLKLGRGIDRKDMHYIPKTYTLEPGAMKAFTLDVRAIDWDDAKWCDVFGAYEVQFVLGGLQTAWTRFRVTAPGEKLPELSPEQAERLRSLIIQLGVADFARREQAHAEIRAFGKAALILLQETAARDVDTEIVARCKRLIQEITQPRYIAQPIPRPQPRPLPPPVVRPQPQPPLPPPDLEF